MLKFTLNTEKPVAVDSPDHLVPHGTKQDNSRNPLFNKKLYALFDHKPLYILDLGCAGGAFVRDCLDDGHLAIGLEGSDYSRKTARAEWPKIPDNLFTCDIAADFQVKCRDLISGEEANARFDVVTAWEVMEHIRKEDLQRVCDNVIRHLRPGGLWIMSVADFQDRVGKIDYHQTVEDKDWWEDFFHRGGFRNHPQLVDYFGHDWIRGPLQGSPSFHFVLTYGDEQPPKPPLTPPYDEGELIKVGIQAREQALAEGTVSSLTLEYAIYLFDEARKRLGDVEGLNYQRSLTLFHLGRFEEARKAAQVELRLHPRHKGAQKLLSHLDSVLRGKEVQDLGGFWMHYNRGVHLREKGDLKASCEELQLAVSLRPEDERASQELREILKIMIGRAMERKEWPEALSLLERFPGEYPNDPEWHYLKARVLHEQGTELQQAHINYSLALRFGFDEFWVRFYRGILLRELKDIDASRTDLERALELRPTHQDAAQHLRQTIKVDARESMQRNQYAAALLLFQRFSGELPADPEWHYLKAQCLHFGQLDLRLALQQYDRALEYGYDEPSVRFYRGILLHQLGELDRSRVDLERAVELQPTNIAAIQHLHEIQKVSQEGREGGNQA